MNIRSIRKYWSLFNILVQDVIPNTDIVVLTETNVSENWWNQFELAGYNSFWFSRSNTGGGGIAVFVKDTWLVSRDGISFCHAGAIALKIENSCALTFLLASYRPSSKSVRIFVDELKEILPIVSTRGLFCLAGDINIDALKQDRPDGCDYLNTPAHEGIENVITAPTREEIIADRLVSSCIDHICIRAENIVAMSRVIKQKLADQYIVGCQVMTDA